MGITISQIQRIESQTDYDVLCSDRFTMSVINRHGKDDVTTISTQRSIGEIIEKINSI